MENIDTDGLLDAIETEEAAAQSAALETERLEALQFFRGEAVGELAAPDIDGRSKIVSRDFADTIDWIMPTLIRMFLGGDEIVKFEPVGPEDEDQAQQETDYINHVVTQQNDAYELFYSWFDDALMSKNGYVMAYVSKQVDVETQHYYQQPEDALLMLTQDPCVEIVAATPNQTEYGLAYDVEVKVRREENVIKTMNIPPEHMRVSSHWNRTSLLDCPFVEYIEHKTASELRDDGFDVSDSMDDYFEQGMVVENVRNPYFGAKTVEREDGMNLMTVRTCFILYDLDQDGIAERYKVVVIGDKIIDIEPAEMVLVACITPRPMAHQHVGWSVFDSVKDLQILKTRLQRVVDDASMLSTLPRTAVDTSVVDLDDLLNPRVGGLIRTTGDPRAAIMPIVTTPDVTGAALSAIEYADSVRENRTGVTRYNQGTDANTLNKTATGINAIMGAAQARIELIARTFAETGVKDLFRIIHHLTCKYSKKNEVVRISGNWVSVNPTEWQTRTNLTISVGLGTGDKQMKAQHIMGLMQIQERLFPIGLASKDNIYHAATEYARNIGFKSADRFFTDPRFIQPQPPKPDPHMAKVMMDGKLKEKQMAMDAHLKQQQAVTDQQTEIIKKQIEVSALQPVPPYMQPFQG